MLRRSENFNQYETEISSFEKQNKLKIIDEKLNRISQNVRLMKKLLSYDIDGYYSKKLIDLIKFSEEILVNYSSLNELEKIKNESNQLIFENEKFLKNIDLAKQQIVLLEKLLAKNLKNKKKSSIIRQIDDLKFKIKINDPKEIIITLKNSSKLIDELSSNDEKINLKTNLYNFVLQSKWTTPGLSLIHI